MKYDDNDIGLIPDEFSDLEPSWGVIDFSETTYKILGIPVWKVKDIEGEGTSVADFMEKIRQGL